MSYPHLDAATALLAEKADAERIARLQDECWIGYTRATQVLTKLEWLLGHSKRSRMPNMLLCGLTNNGKTSIITRFLMDHPPRLQAGGDADAIPVLAVEAPSGPDVRRFYLHILRALTPDYPASRTLAVQEADAVHLMAATGVRILIVDEIHNILSGKRDQLRQFLNVLRFLGNRLQIPLVAVGVKEALAAMQADDQTANRFDAFVLPRWRLGEEYLMLLDSLEGILPLRSPSDLSDAPNAERIMVLSEGILGEIIAILARAAEKSILCGKERIDTTILRELDFTPPSQRRHQAHAQLAD